MTPEERYQEEKKSHDAFIRGYQGCMNDIERVSGRFDDTGIIQQLLHRLAQEKSMRDSCDAPNAPGYYRANND